MTPLVVDLASDDGPTRNFKPAGPNVGDRLHIVRKGYSTSAMVVGFHARDEVWLARHEDGDCEDLNKDDLLKFLITSTRAKRPQPDDWVYNSQKHEAFIKQTAAAMKKKGRFVMEEERCNFAEWWVGRDKAKLKRGRRNGKN